MLKQLSSTTIFDSKLQVALLSALLALFVIALLVLLDSAKLYFALADLAKNVPISSVQKAEQARQQALQNLFWLQFCYLAPISALLGVIFSLLCFRTMHDYTTKSRICLSLVWAPISAVVVFLSNPHAEFLIPFNPDIWRTYYSPASRSRMVEPLLRTLHYCGNSKKQLIETLGYPDHETLNSDGSGSISYSVSQDNRDHLNFYFNKSRVVTGAEHQVNLKKLNLFSTSLD